MALEKLSKNETATFDDEHTDILSFQSFILPIIMPNEVKQYAQEIINLNKLNV